MGMKQMRNEGYQKKGQSNMETTIQEKGDWQCGYKNLKARATFLDPVKQKGRSSSMRAFSSRNIQLLAAFCQHGPMQVCLGLPIEARARNKKSHNAQNGRIKVARLITWNVQKAGQVVVLRFTISQSLATSCCLRAKRLPSLPDSSL
jgi:hypothetical protein